VSVVCSTAVAGPPVTVVWLQRGAVAVFLAGRVCSRGLSAALRSCAGGERQVVMQSAAAELFESSREAGFTSCVARATYVHACKPAVLALQLLTTLKGDVYVVSSLTN